MSRIIIHWFYLINYRAADKSLTRPTSRCILFDGENISFDASLVIYIYILKLLTNLLGRYARVVDHLAVREIVLQWIPGHSQIAGNV